MVPRYSCGNRTRFTVKGLVAATSSVEGKHHQAQPIAVIQSRRHFSSQAKDRRFGSTTKVAPVSSPCPFWNSRRFIAKGFGGDSVSILACPSEPIPGCPCGIFFRTQWMSAVLAPVRSSPCPFWNSRRFIAKGFGGDSVSHRNQWMAELGRFFAHRVTVFPRANSSFCG